MRKCLPVVVARFVLREPLSALSSSFTAPVNAGILNKRRTNINYKTLLTEIARSTQLKLRQNSRFWYQINKQGPVFQKLCVHLNIAHD